MSNFEYGAKEKIVNHCFYCQKCLSDIKLNSVHYDLDGSRYYCDKCRFTPTDDVSLSINIQIPEGSQKADVLRLISKLNLWLDDDNELWEFLKDA